MKSERPAAAALRILHLEDDPLDGEFLQVNLREAGLQCDILRVDTKSGFVTALQEREFDLVISDLSLPAFNGMAALEIVRERYPDIPFIFVSGTIGEEAAIDSLLSGATDYVLKHRFARLVPAVQRVMRDAEERKRRRKTEQQLALASTQLHNLFDNLDDVFISLDAVQNRLLQISPSCERISGWPSRAFLDDARLWEKCVFEHDLAGFSDVVSSLRVGKSVQEQFRAVHRDGTVRWIEARLKPVIDHVGKLVRIDGILSDVSERKNAEEALRASEERYRLLFENNPHPMWVYDAQTLGFLAVNDAAVEAYGYDRTEFLQMTVPDIRETIEGGSTQQHKKKDGTRIEVEIASHGFVFSGRDAKLILANDVTEKKKIEAQLMRSQRVETIGTLASGIAHDLNNILAPILMGTQLLRERSRDERDRQTLETLELSTRRGADLVKQVLAFARGIESRRGTLQVRHLLRDVEKILGETLPKSIQLVDEVAANLWPVSGDSTQLNQLFMNLCINARDAMAAGGVLTVSARNSEIAGTQNLKTTGLKEGFYVVVE
ncbi:MAG TPA: PAS domain S-box protein, partial [Terriglobia bacterium]